MPQLFRKADPPRESMSTLILEQIRRYSKKVDSTDTAAIRAILFGDVNGVVPGVIPVNNPGDPPDFNIEDIFNDSVLPNDVSDVSETGDDPYAMRRDAKIRGVHSLSKLSGAALFGDVTLSEGAGIQITQTGQDIRFTNTGQGTGGSGGTTFPITQRTVEYFTLTPSSSLSFTLQHVPLGDPQVYFDGQRKFKALHWSLIGGTVTFFGITPIQDDRVIVEYFWNVNAGQEISFDGAKTINRVVEYYQIDHTHSLDFTLLYSPLGDVGVYYAGQRKFKGLHYSQVDRFIDFDVSIAPIDGDLVIFDYFYTTESGDVSTSEGLDFSNPDGSGYVSLF